MSSIILDKVATPPAPPAGTSRIFVSIDDGFEVIDESGVVTKLKGTDGTDGTDGPAGPAGAAVIADFGQDTGTTTDLVYGYNGGNFGSGNVITAIAAGTITLAASTTNYVHVNGSGVATNTTGFDDTHAPMATVVTDGSGITSITDDRAFLALSSSGAAAGANTQIQFNDAGAFGASANLTFDGATLGVNGNVDVAAGQTYKLDGQDVITASPTLNNYFFGGAGNSAMTGTSNVANGTFALYSNTTGSNNLANGTFALAFNTTGDYNVAGGTQALYNNTTGFRNVANGFQALYSNTTGFNNVASGYYTLFHNTTGSNNIANGAAALSFNTTGNYNIANGASALYSNTTGSNNIANGYQALYGNTTGGDNIANGYRALRYNTTGIRNIANGAQALYYNTTGSSNIANGFQALYSNTTGSNNTGSGYQAGAFVADGTTGNATSTNSLYLGYSTKALSDGDTNEIVIGYGATGNGSNTVTLGNSSVTDTYLAGAPHVNGAYKLPSTDGTVGQALTTNGEGMVVWSSAGSGTGAATNAANVFTDVQTVAPYSTDISGAVSIDLAATAKSNTLVLTATAAVTSLAFTAPVDGAIYNIYLVEDSTGGWAWPALPSNFDFGAAGAPTLTTTAGAINQLSMQWIAALSKFRGAGSAG